MPLRRMKKRTPRGRARPPLILIIDNYDSFVYNLAQYFGELGARVEVKRNDAIDLAGVKKMSPDGVVISPGPGHPENFRDFGVCKEIILEHDAPLIGVCLGHQGIGAAFGAKVVRAHRLVHGKISTIEHDGKGVLAGIPTPLIAGRYHSLAVARDSVRPPLIVTAQTADGEVMGLRHQSRPIEGVQFHPESVLTPDGMKIVSNFLVSLEAR